MNSQNHVMLLGDLMIWYFENMAGIKSDPEHPAFKKVIMKPDFNAGLKFVNASYKSGYGEIKSNWKRDKKKLSWELSIPPNSSAKIYVPASKNSEVKINKQPLDHLATTIVKQEDSLVFELPSGDYSILVN